MSAQSNILNIIINPSGEERLEPGASSQLRVVVANQARYGMVIEVELDLPASIREWCKSTRTSFNIDSGRSQEVVFNWAVPIEALPGDYNYDVVVDCRERLPAPLRYSRRMQILTPKVPVVSSKDPTFTLKPVTSSTKPIVWQWGQTISIQVIVHNRSKIVDEFYISCDLNDDWYEVRYPEGIEAQGLITGGKKLSLNPNTKGQIILLLHPPADTLAGNYQPTINIHSAVQSDLFLQDIFYLRIPPVYDLQVELQTIRNKVKQKPALYEIELKNEGNTIRQVSLEAHTADEEEFGEYQLERSQLRIPPGKSIKVPLKVLLKRKRQRSFLRAKQLNFAIDLEDLEQNPLPKNIPLQGTLLWQARPWWQLLFIILIVLSILGGAFFFVRWILSRSAPVPEIVKASTDDKSYTYGQKITLNWEIKNADKLESIRFYTDKNSPGEPIEKKYNKSELIKPTPIFAGRYKCLLQEKLLKCREVVTGAASVGKYIFNIELYADNNSKYNSTIETEIEEPKRPVVADIKTAKEEYKPNEKIDLQFEIDRPSLVEKIQISSSNQFRIETQEYNYADEQEITLKKLKEKKFCKERGSDRNQLQCTVPISFRSEGNYGLSIELTSNYEPFNQNKTSGKLEKSIEIKKAAIRLEILKFTINGRAEGPIRLKRNQRINLYWQVKGEEVKVSIVDSGRTYGKTGTTRLGPYREGSSKTITLTAKDKEGNIETRSIDIEVESLPNPVNLEPREER